MLKENLKDAGEILQNILTQPLAISDAPSDITLLKAAKDYHPGHGASSDLSKILRTFLEYPAPTERLITELEIILKDLEVKK
jgi:hypothetical protein